VLNTSYVQKVKCAECYCLICGIVRTIASCRPKEGTEYGKMQSGFYILIFNMCMHGLL